MANTNPTTGIRYGVIAMNSIDPDVANELWYGPGAVDMSYENACAEARKEAAREFDNLLESAEVAAYEIDPGMSDSEREAFIERWFEEAGEFHDQEAFVDARVDYFGDQCQIDEPVIEGKYEGIDYMIDWLGGAPLLWVFEGPIGWANELCSPCVPNAANLDGGFGTGEVADDCRVYPCYVIPRDWLAKEV